MIDYPSGKQGILFDPRDANLARQRMEGGKDSGKKHTDRRIKPRLVIMKAPGAVPMAPAFGWD